MPPEPPPHVPAPRRPDRPRRRGPAGGVLAALGAASLATGLASAFVPGPEDRDVRPDRVGLEPPVERALALAEHACLACHHAPGASPPPPAGPDLTDVGARVAPGFLVAFLADPATVHPTSRMPDVLHGLAPEERLAAARDLARYLASLGEDAFDPRPVEDADPARGEALFHRVGCVACHAPRRGPAPGRPTPPTPPGAVSLDAVPAKYGPRSLAAFLHRPLAVRPHGAMPDLDLDRGEARDLAAYLLGDVARPPEWSDPSTGDAAAGRARFDALGCAACHALEGHAPPPAAPAPGDWVPGAGCLSPDPGAVPGAAPRYDLSDAERALLAAALVDAADPDAAPTDRQALDRELARLRCLACHERDGRGGVAAYLDPYVTTREPELGDHARIPPALTGVGGKLQRRWTERLLLDGERSRAYMDLRMPHFGADNVAALPELLERVDPAGDLAYAPPEGKRREVLRDAGRELLGNRGLACVSCHDFNGKDSPVHGGIDLISTTERLRPAWLRAFLLDPQAVRPGIVMPDSWPGGVAALDTVLEGDTDAQLEALWYFLTLGTSAPDPAGVHAEPTRLAVTDRARTYRGRSRVAGFRGIAVGFPGGWSYAFDAQHGALAALWRGDFVQVRWDGQGAGDFHPAARPVELARDVALTTLEDEDAPWPLRPHVCRDAPTDPDPTYARDAGYRFRGYQLDGDGVPTLLYDAGDVAVEDRSHPAPPTSTPGQGGTEGADDPPPVLVRTLRLTAPGPRTLYLRVLTGDVEAVDPRTYRTADLQVRVRGDRAVVRAVLRDGPAREATPLWWHEDAPDPPARELLVVLELDEGTTEIEIDHELLR